MITHIMAQLASMLLSQQWYVNFSSTCVVISVLKINCVCNGYIYAYISWTRNGMQ